MKTVYLFILFVPLLTSAQINDIEQFKWIVGKWQGTSGEGQLVENWKKLDENTLLGEGYYIVKNDTILKEYLKIERFGRHWAYIATINDRQPALFSLVESKNNTLVFENKEHDFPQRVVYSFKKDGSLLAWIEGNVKGKAQKEEYSMQKTE